MGILENSHNNNPYSGLKLASHARQFAAPINKDLENKMRSLVDDGTIRPADACNLLMTHSGIKPTFLIVQSTKAGCNDLLASVRATSGYDLHVEVHFDPDTKQYYFIGCRSQEKKDFIESLTEQSCSRLPDSPVFSLIIPSAFYHRQLGVFLDVPDCCLVERAVMPDEADSIFREMKEGVDSGRLSSDVHYSPHLPCSCGCKETFAVGRVYRSFIETHFPDYAERFHKERDQKPLYLY